MSEAYDSSQCYPQKHPSHILSRPLHEKVYTASIMIGPILPSIHSVKARVAAKPRPFPGLQNSPGPTLNPDVFSRRQHPEILTSNCTPTRLRHALKCVRVPLPQKKTVVDTQKRLRERSQDKERYLWYHAEIMTQYSTRYLSSTRRGNLSKSSRVKNPLETRQVTPTRSPVTTTPPPPVPQCRCHGCPAGPPPRQVRQQRYPYLQAVPDVLLIITMLDPTRDKIHQDLRQNSSRSPVRKGRKADPRKKVAIYHIISYLAHNVICREAA